MPLEQTLKELFLQKSWTLSLAESCSGGALAARLVTIPDCSLYFSGGIVAYSNMAKSRLLGVSPQLLKDEGAVSEVVAREMARGAVRQFSSSYAMSVTGIAGPNGETPRKPLGMVCFGIAGLKETTWTRVFSGDRREIIEQSVQEGLSGLISFLFH